MNRAQTNQQFAQWLEDTHPELYEALFAHAMAYGASRLSGLGDDSPIDPSLSDFTPTTQDISVDQGNLDYVTASAYGDAVDALPGDLTSLIAPAQPVSSTQGVTGSSGSVANWLTSNQGLTAIANLGTAVLGTIATTQVAKAQMAVIQAQAQRAAQGQTPVPITYVTGANGAHIPVYVASVGQQIPTSISKAIGTGGARPVTLPDGSTGYALNTPTLTSVFGGSNLIWVLLLGAGLLVAVASRS